MAVGVADVKKSLAPLGVARRRLGANPRGDEPGIEGVDIGVIKDEAAPPRPLPLPWLQDQVEKIVAGAETGEGRLLAAAPRRQRRSTRPAEPINSQAIDFMCQRRLASPTGFEPVLPP